LPATVTLARLVAAGPTSITAADGLALLDSELDGVGLADALGDRLGEGLETGAAPIAR